MRRVTPFNSSFDAALVRDSYKKVLEREHHLARLFYEKLFAKHPELQSFFSATPAVRAHQEKMFAMMLVAIMDRIDDSPWIDQEMAQLGAKHRRFQLTDANYHDFGVAFLETIAHVAGADFTHDVERAWRGAWDMLTAAMKKAHG